MEDKFKLYKKWFWVGIAVGFFNFVAGLIYAFALMAEKEHRREGIIILIWTLIVFVLLASLIGPLV
jgi:Mg/Co/Ni transporter MgtE